MFSNQVKALEESKTLLANEVGVNHVLKPLTITLPFPGDDSEETAFPETDRCCPY